MIKIHLFCNAGMSTSLLVEKMKKAAYSSGIECEIEAFPASEMEHKIEGIDVALLGPQVGYLLKKAEVICSEKEVPVSVIPMQDYGLCNGESVLNFAIKLADK